MSEIILFDQNGFFGEAQLEIIDRCVRGKDFVELLPEPQNELLPALNHYKEQAVYLTENYFPSHPKFVRWLTDEEWIKGKFTPPMDDYCIIQLPHYNNHGRSDSLIHWLWTHSETIASNEKYLQRSALRLSREYISDIYLGFNRVEFPYVKTYLSGIVGTVAKEVEAYVPLLKMAKSFLLSRPPGREPLMYLDTTGLLLIYSITRFSERHNSREP